MQKPLLRSRLLSWMLQRMIPSILLIVSFSGYAQSSTQSYSFNWKNTPIPTVFNQIEKAANVHFSYNPKDLDLQKKISLMVSKQSLQQVIDLVTKELHAQYKIVGETVMIQSEKPTAKVSSQVVEDFSLTGKVTDDQNQPLPGVTVVNTTKNRSAVTNETGSFVITVTNGDVITFALMGYEINSIIATDKIKTVKITLKTKATELNTVVVTALGIKREERSLGYATAEVDGNDLKHAREPNVTNSLAGKVPGLIINSTAGGPAGSSRVIIRGNTSITGNNQPLYVVDGVPIDNSNYGQVGGGKYSGGFDFGDAISAINPDDIDKISVLKGPSASALYGSRAGNGVILITTKKGNSKKELGIEVNSTSSIENQLTHYNDYQYIYGQGTAEQMVVDPSQAKNTLFNNFGPRLDPNLQVIGFDGKYRPYALVKNNIDNFFRTGATTTNNVAFSNSNDISSFRLSITDMRSRDIVPGSNLRRNTFNFTGSSKFGSKVTLSAKVMYLNEDVVNRPALADDPGNIGNAFVGLANNVDQAYFKNGYKDSEGNYVDWGGGQYRLDPYWVINEMRNETRKNRFIGTLQGNYIITSWLNLQGRISTDFTYLTYNKFSPRTTPGALAGELDQFAQKMGTTEGDALLTAQKQVSPSLNLALRLGGSFSRIDNPGTTSTFINLNVPDVVSPNSFSDKSVVENHYRKRNNGAYALLSIGYKSYLYVDASVRKDASSTLPQDNNSYVYPSVAASFIFSDFFKINPSILSFGKLRISGAEVGNDTDPYLLNLNYNLYPQTFNGTSVGGIASTVLPNKNLKPTRTKSFEIGTQLKFFGERLNLDVSYYTSKSRDQINLVPAPLSSGFAQQLVNAGVIGNKGAEIALNGSPVATKDFGWEINVNFAKNTNTVLSLADGIPYLSLSDARWLGVSVVAKPGSPYGSILGFDYQRDSQGNIVLDPQTLAPKQAEERSVLGKGTWSWTGGLANTFRYKNFGLSAVIDIKHGADLFSMTNMFAIIRGSHVSTLPGRAEWIKSEEQRQTAGMTIEQWRAAGKVQGYIPQGVLQTGTDANGNPVYTKNTTAVDPSNYWSQFYSDGNGVATPFIYDASYIKMREITLSYRFPSSAIAKLGIKDLTVAVVSRNPFIIHKNVPNVDPDSNYNNGNGQGLEYGSLPSRRSWGFNVNFRF